MHRLCTSPRLLALVLAMLLAGCHTSPKPDQLNIALAVFPDEAARYHAGEKKLQGVLVGFVMKKSKGRADPKRVNQLLSSRGG